MILGYAIVVAVFWSISPVVYKYALGTANQSSIIFISAIIYFILALIYFVFARGNIIKDSSKLLRKDILGWLILANVTTFLGQIIYMYALDNHKSHVITALAFTSPLFTLLLAWMFLKEQVTTKSIIGVITIVIGVILLSH